MAAVPVTEPEPWRELFVGFEDQASRLYRSTKNNFLSGWTTWKLLPMMWKYRREIEWRQFWIRAMYLVLLSFFNGICAWVESVRFRKEMVEQGELPDDPVIILGCPRSGTTLIHMCLAADEEQFYSPDLFQVSFPESFLTLNPLRKWMRPLLQGETRPMDNVRLSWELPSEDELAVAALTGGACETMALVFPSQWKSVLHENSIHSASEDVRHRWKEAFTQFCRKITLFESKESQKCTQRRGRRRLLLRSPSHTNHIRQLLQIFPNAEFIFVHRHPLEVFRSSLHMVKSYVPFCTLQHCEPHDLLQYVLENYRTTMNGYLDDRGLIRPGRLFEVGLGELEENLQEGIRRIYHGLGLFDGSIKPSLIHHWKLLADFKKNDHQDVPYLVECQVRTLWRRSFDAFGYAN
eukprot:CAMPEP_0184688966 /NCGR_PEP_ID=MMETSP0312-20130426/30387_1 /TAXON_ID=31354 /ORGANISM="Compsopogon coeruleus, Strain SAG 36.94" /LENGTH=405 /DNA_ID=CAMNT_0027146249 /DNA_START=1440 /DNA_END=2657 /DNA_ORIENTATION=-